MQSSNDIVQREGHDQRRETKLGKELANEKRKHCTRSGLTLIFVKMMVCLRVCMYEWCTTSLIESERNRASGSACERKQQNVIEHILIGVGKSVDFSDCILHTDEHAQKVPSRGYNTLDRYLVPANNLPQEYLDQPLTRAQNAALCAASSVPTSATTRTDEH
ncbi:hypothetical protein PV325_004497 [Microctonus aethiopoides]|nr:hypothetical protein PV325_004497 [Microctonus aethiopoides]